MNRTTIDYGIDLGTTNSTIAVLNGTTPEVIANQHGSSITPSAIWYDKKGRLQVGQKARDNYFLYPDGEEDGALEFKLRMGESWSMAFRHGAAKMTPEDMSAEVLKELKRDVQTAKGEDVKAAVITVPAAFELPQCEATRRAGEIAGFAVSPLLQEPVAAALAYGFQSAANKVFWLVYDFGGGTFDAAVIQVRDGVIQVVNHAGHNYLGGKNIDWEIVEKLLVPRLEQEYDLDGVTRADPKWKPLLWKLKYYAEEAKIQVSRMQRPFLLVAPNLRIDGCEDAVDLEFELTPADLERLTAPWINQSLTLCKRALEEKGLSGADIEKTIMVGGTSLFPWLRSQVKEELGTQLDFSIDPVTVVARGAAVFAAGQRFVADDRPVAAGTYRLQLEYEAIGSDTDPMIGGRVQPPPGVSLQGVTVEIVESRSQWRSGKISLSQNGTFMTEVHAETGRKCEFMILLADARGSRLPCTPDRFPYTVGMVITSPPLTHSVGVAMANNKVDVFFKKGDTLPNRATHYKHQTVNALRRNQPKGDTNIIRIPIVEGENMEKADRNRCIGFLEISPDDPRVKRDVPAGQEVEITIEIDPSRTVKTRVFISILDEVFEKTFDPKTTPRSPAELRAELDEELERLAGLEDKAEAIEDTQAQAALARIGDEQIVEHAEGLVSAAQGDRDAIAEGDRKLLDLRAAVDSVQDALEWPALVTKAQSQLRDVHGFAEKQGNHADKQELAVLQRETQAAIKNRSLELLRINEEKLESLGFRILMRDPGIWIAWLQDLERRRTHMIDQVAADKLLTQARRAVSGNDFEILKAAVRQLIGLLPPDEQEEAQSRGKLGGTTLLF